MSSVPAWVLPHLRCPRCSTGELRARDAALRCESCAAEFPCDGVPRLIKGDARAWNPHRTPSRARIDEHLRHLEATGWIGDAMIDGVPAGDLVLSVGEGCGEMLVRLATRRPDRYFVGTDISVDRVANATELAARRGLRNVWFCVADATRLPFAAHAFEAGYTRGVLHVLPDPESALAEMRRVLRSRLLVDRLANRPFFALWFWLLQRYENLRARVQRRAPDPGIWQSVVETLETGTYRPLWRYRAWFRRDRAARVRATSLFIWETPTHRPVLGWLGIGGAIDVRL